MAECRAIAQSTAVPAAWVFHVKWMGDLPAVGLWIFTEQCFWRTPRAGDCSTPFRLPECFLGCKKLSSHIASQLCCHGDTWSGDGDAMPSLVLHHMLTKTQCRKKKRGPWRLLYLMHSALLQRWEEVCVFVCVFFLSVHCVQTLLTWKALHFGSVFLVLTDLYQIQS